MEQVFHLASLPRYQRLKELGASPAEIAVVAHYDSIKVTRIPGLIDALFGRPLNFDFSGWYTGSLDALRLSEMVLRVGWQYLKPGDRVDLTTTKHTFIVGVAQWSCTDAYTLEMLTERTSGTGAAVYVFSLDDITDGAAFAAVMPGVSLPQTDPVVAEYEGGKLLRCSQGYSAFRDWW
jgi:hypothetical protein